MAIAKAAKAGSAKSTTSKRSKKVLVGTVAGISAGAVRRMARRAGIKRISAALTPEIRGVLKGFVEDVVRAACTIAEHSRRSILSCADVVSALRAKGKSIYGYV